MTLQEEIRNLEKTYGPFKKWDYHTTTWGSIAHDEILSNKFILNFGDKWEQYYCRTSILTRQKLNYCTLTKLSKIRPLTDHDILIMSHNKKISSKTKILFNILKPFDKNSFIGANINIISKYPPLENNILRWVEQKKLSLL